MNILKTAETIAAGSRAASHNDAFRLAARIGFVQQEIIPPLVKDEKGPVDIGPALGRLVAGRTRREGGGPVTRIEAQMQAGIVAALVAASHEMDTGEPVTQEAQLELEEAFTAFGLRYAHEAAPSAPALR